MFRTFCVCTVHNVMFCVIFAWNSFVAAWKLKLLYQTCLCKLQNKNFSMVCCTTLWWDGTGKGRGWKTAAIIYCWQLSDISSGTTCIADLDSGALALTKEASGNSCEECTESGNRPLRSNLETACSQPRRWKGTIKSKHTRHSGSSHWR